MAANQDGIQPYEVTLRLNVLSHLGTLYSNVPAVLSEIVENAWDADRGYSDRDRQEPVRVVISDTGPS